MEINSGTYVISGITGFLGGLIARTLAESPAYSRGEISIVGIARDSLKAGEFIRNFPRGNVRLMEADIVDYPTCLREMGRMLTRADFFLHCAAGTASAEMISRPVETADGIVVGTRNMLELARAFGVRSMVCLSSMEVYGRVPDTGMPRGEEELGEISTEAVRSCYSLGKRMAEHYCHSFHQEYGLPVKIARLAQIFGTGVRLEDSRVYMQFARAAAEGRDIVLRTRGLSMGNYCGSEDAVRAVLTILERGADGETYNVVNEANTMRIGEMAALVAERVAGGRIGVRVEEEDPGVTGYAPDTGLRLSSRKLRQLGWKPEKGLAQMYEDVMRELKKQGNSGRY